MYDVNKKIYIINKILLNEIKGLRMVIKKLKNSGMEDLLRYVEYHTGKSGAVIAAELDMSRQSYSQLKTKGLTDRQKLMIIIKRKYNLTWDQIGKCLEKDAEK